MVHSTLENPPTNSAALRGMALLHEPSLNKGTAFTESERDQLGLRGLLPPRVFTQTDQALRVMENLRKKPNKLEQYIYLIGLQDRNEGLYYRVVLDNLAELMPIIYTPTVGQACQEYGSIFRRPRGLFITHHDREHIRQILRNWPYPDVRMIVVTDGERILGLGDLGAQGMGIPVGKLALYTVGAGVNPTACLPIALDVGTNNQTLLHDPNYIGLLEPRLQGAAYDEFLDEFMQAVADVFPQAVIQLEDFGNANAFRLLERYREHYCTFDDDIQGTAAVTLAGLYSALRITGQTLAEQRILFFGAGEAAIGTGNLIVSALMAEGLSVDEARKRCWFVDSKGLIVADRTDLVAHKRAFAHAVPFQRDLHDAIVALQPTALIGASGQPNTFTPDAVRLMATNNERPIIFALSNPTSKSECTAEVAYQNTDGRAIFASGSPFADVTLDGKTFVSGQANNAYVFPGIGLGLLAAEATRVPDAMFFAAARALADQVSAEDLALGRVYPALSRIRDVSLHIAHAVATIAFERHLTAKPAPTDLDATIRAIMYDPDYRDVR